MSRSFRPLLWVWGWAWTATAAAQAAPAMPSDPQVGATRYVSAFECYRTFADQPVRHWAQVNEEVRRIGGWRAYAREASEAAEAAEPAAADAGDERCDGGHLRH